MPKLIRFYAMLIARAPSPDPGITFSSLMLTLCACSMGKPGDSSEQGREGHHTGSAPSAGTLVSRSPSNPSI